MSSTRRELLAAVRPKDEQRILARLISMEQSVAGGLFRDQSRAHIRVLTQALKDLGGTPPQPFAGGAPQRDLLVFETRMIGAYQSAIKTLEKGDLVRTLAEIMANHGQRLVVLRQALGRDPVPAAFEPL
jgi:hypothetical protein